MMCITVYEVKKVTKAHRLNPKPKASSSSHGSRRVHLRENWSLLIGFLAGIERYSDSQGL